MKTNNQNAKKKNTIVKNNNANAEVNETVKDNEKKTITKENTEAKSKAVVNENGNSNSNNNDNSKNNNNNENNEEGGLEEYLQRQQEQSKSSGLLLTEYKPEFQPNNNNNTNINSNNKDELTSITEHIEPKANPLSQNNKPIQPKPSPTNISNIISSSDIPLLIQEQSKQIESNIEDPHFDNKSLRKEPSLQLTEPSPDPNTLDLTYSEKESFLKNKLTSLNLNPSITKAITSGLDNTIIEIQENIKQDKFKISPISRDISNLLPSPSNTSIQEIIKTKAINKTLRKLKQKEQKLQQDITLLTIHQKTLADESYINCNNSLINNNIRLSKIADLKQKHSVLLNQLSEIRTQVDNLLQSEKQLNRKNNIKAFLERIENDKESYEAKIQKYEEQSSILQQKRLNDLNRSIEKKEKEYLQKEKEEKDRKIKFIETQRKKEKDIIHKRKQEMDAQMEKTKQYINNKCEKTKREYLFYKMKSDYEENEHQFISKAKMKKKAELTSKHELNELKRRMAEQKLLLEKDAVEKTHIMKEMWRNRSQLIPSYKSPMLQKIKEEDIKQKENEEMLKMKGKIYYKDKILYANKINKPEMCVKLKQQREKQIETLNANHNDTKTRISSIQELHKKRHKNALLKQQLFSICNSSNNNNNNIINTHCNSEECEACRKMVKSNSMSALNMATQDKIKEMLNKKPRNVFAEYHINNINVERVRKDPKTIDYLTAMRKKKETERKANSSGMEMEFVGVNWEKEMKDPKGNRIENLQIMHNKINHNEEKIALHKEFMNVNGGYGKNPDIGGKISNLLIENIKAKLTIVDEFAQS